MKKKIVAMLTSIAVIFTTVGNVYADKMIQNNEIKVQNKVSSQLGEYVVMTKDKKLNEEIKREYSFKNSEYTELSNENNINIVDITEEEAQVLENKEEVKVVEKNIELKGSSTVINPKEVQADWNFRLINANHQEKNVKDKIKIAMIDSGVDECEGIDVVERINLIPEEKEVLPCFDDGAGHGTAIAGILAGQKVDNRESEGINSNVELYSIKVLNGANTAPLSRVVEGIYKAIECDVDIINMSFGTPENSEILHKAIQDAYDNNILMIAAAGNRGKSDCKVEYPAAYSEVMSVGSVDASGNIAESSSIGGNVDVMAPGEMVRTVTNFGFETVGSGTSLAVPHVAGVASVIWQKDKTKSAEFVRGLIEETANKRKVDNVTYSIVDLEYALEKYDEYAENYKNKGYKVRSNLSDLSTNIKMIKVTALWTRNDHATLVSNNKNVKLTTKEVNMIKAGIRYNDKWLSPDANTPNRKIWHSLGKESNLMSSTFFVGKVIQESNCNPNNVAQTPGLTTAQYNQIKSDIQAINWSDKVLKIEGLTNISDYPNNIKNKRLLLFGMALHIVTDAFAHKAYKRKPYLSGASMSHWEHVSDTDNPNEVPSRYKAAGKVVKNAMEQCLRFESGSVVMKNTYTIRSRQIMEGNTYFDTSFLIGYLVNNAAENKSNDTTFSTWESKMRANTYDASLS